MNSAFPGTFSWQSSNSKLECCTHGKLISFESNLFIEKPNHDTVSYLNIYCSLQPAVAVIALQYPIYSVWNGTLLLMIDFLSTLHEIPVNAIQTSHSSDSAKDTKILWLTGITKHSLDAIGVQVVKKFQLQRRHLLVHPDDGNDCGTFQVSFSQYGRYFGLLWDSLYLPNFSPKFSSGEGAPSCCCWKVISRGHSVPSICMHFNSGNTPFL